MLSDEEKKAIETLTNKRPSEQMLISGKMCVNVLVNLIEKQSKEIEHQKEKRENQKQELAILNAKQIEFNKLVNTVNSYKGQFKRQQKEIEELKEDNKKKSIVIIEYQDLYEKLVDKIEAKIDEEKECGSVDGTNEMIIEVLQSLLEKE